MSIYKIKSALKEKSSKEKAIVLRGFFKTGPGEYGEGDIFIGVVVAQIRKIAKEYQFITIKECLFLLKSKIHEERLVALLILVFKYLQAKDKEKENIYNLYLSNTRYINNWDLVDLTAKDIVGAFLFNKDKSPLYDLARSNFLWDRRISIVATYYFIKRNKFIDTLNLAKLLISDNEPLIHKATGWMLREVGKAKISKLEDFLKKNYKIMPRTMLRYSIELFPENKRVSYLKGKI